MTTKTKRTVIRLILAMSVGMLLGLIGSPQQKMALPNHEITPGVIDPALVADLSKAKRMHNGVEVNICAPDFRTPPFRVATKSTSIKRKVCVAYGITTGCPGQKYELDDLCSIEMGCKNSQANLWPQPIVEARIKDHQVEDKLGGPRGLICRGKISLLEAQHCIIDNWITCQKTVQALESK